MSYTSLKTEMLYAVQRLEENITTATSRADPQAATDYNDYLFDLVGDVARLEDSIKQVEKVQEKIAGFLQKSDHPDNNAKLDALATGNATQKVKGYLQSLSEARNLLVDTNIKQKIITSKLAATATVPAVPNVPIPAMSPFTVSDYFTPKPRYDPYDGNRKGFGFFWTRYGPIHNNKNISDAEKLNILLGMLKGEALQALSKYDITDKNYPLALKTFKDKFGKQEDVISQLNDEFYALSAMDDSVKQTKKVYDDAEIILIQLESNGEDINHQQFRSQWINKMPSWVKEACYLRHGLYGRLSDYREHAGNLIDIKEKSLPTSVSQTSNVNVAKNSDSKHKKKGMKPDNQLSNAPSSDKGGGSDKGGSESGGQQKNRGKKKRDCCLCGDSNHSTTSCRKYPTVESRRARCKDIGRCTTCCSDKHTSSECTNSQPCLCCKKTNHCVVFCYERLKKKTEDNKKVQTHAAAVVDNSMNSTVTTTAAKIDKEDIVLPLAKASIANPLQLQFVKTATLLDGGSMLSYILLDHAYNLDLQPVDRQYLDLVTFNNETVKTINAPIFEILVQCVDDEQQRIYVRGIDRITDELIMASRRNDDTRILFESVKPQVLIGSDFLYKFMDCEELPSGYFLVKTRLGDIICGPGPGIHKIGQDSSVGTFTVRANYSNPDKKLDNVIQEFVQLDVGGLNGDPNETEREVAIKHFKETFTREPDGTFVVRHFWKSDSPKLASNKQLAFYRLRSTMQKLQKDKKAAIAMNVFNEHKERKFIEFVPNGLDDLPRGYVHYLAFHFVQKDSPTTPFRAVFDCSAVQKPNDLSLNDNLYTCAPNMPDLIGLMVIFRSYPIVITADIEKAFLAVKLHHDDRDVFRFLLPIDPSKPITWDNVEVWRYTCPLFGAGPSPFQLEQCVRELLENENHPVAKELIDRMFVDNSLLGAFTVEEGKKKAEVSQLIFKKANMNLRDHISNCKEISDYMHSTVPAKHSFLGTKWKPEKDTISIAIPNPKEVKKVTKRKILSFIASIFDPMGLLAPVVFEGKVILQGLWKKQLKWDTVLDDVDIAAWNKYQFVNGGKEIELLRYVLSPEATERHLITFSDASEKGIGACAYIREKLPDESYRNNLFLSKTRLQKLADKDSKITISKMEMMAAALGAALMKFIHEHFPLPLDSSTLMVDSTCVLGWLNSRANLGRFIENRKRFIFEAAPTISHVRTADNPADIASRGCTMPELISNKMWWHGPAWLQLPESKWPSYAVEPVHRPPSQCLEELPKFDDPPAKVDEAVVLAAQARHAKKVTLFGFDTERWSKWTKLVGVIAAFLFFIKRCGKKLSSPFMDPLLAVCATRFFDHQMYGYAEKTLVRYLQQKYPPTKNIMRSLQLVMNEQGLLVCSHRIPVETAPPLIWLPECFEVNKYVLFLHERLNHSGPRHVLNELRLQYWLCRGKQVVKKILRNDCYHCKRYHLRPYELPKMPSLPRERVEIANPFKYTGVDYCGPFDIKIKLNEDGTTKEIVQKAWICLFTCMVTRNVHLEVCLSMDGPTFVNAFRRFISRFSCPSIIWSDRGTNFVAAQKFVEPAWTFENSTSVARLIQNKKIKWNFITEKSPWKGGVWERMVGLVKTNLRHAIGRRKLYLDEFHTFVAEVESIVNSRPITPVDTEYDPNAPDLLLALRPVDFLNPFYHPAFPQIDKDYDSDPDFIVQKSTEAKLRLLYHKTAQLREKFWKKWTREYLNQLREQATHFHRQSKFSNVTPRIGNVVIVEEDDVPMDKWRLAVVIQLNQSADNIVRTAVVRTASNRELNRPLSKLYPLEVQVADAATINYRRPAEKDDEAMADTDEIPQEKPRYNLRPRGPKAITSLFVLGLIACLVVGTLGHECQMTERSLKLIYAENCTSQGLAVYQQADGYYCWKNIDCGLYHLHDYSKLPDQDHDICQERCKCPEWSDDCTFYNSSITSTEKQTYLQLIRDATPMEHDSIIHLIQLHDGTDYVVRQLKLLKEDDFGEIICFGEGNTFNGSPLFCSYKNDTCDPKAKKFCVLPHHELVYAVLHGNKVPIRAWKTVDKPPKPLIQPIQEQLPISCMAGQIYVNSTENIRKLQVQSGTSYMVFTPNSSTIQIQVPLALLTATRDFSITYWNKFEGYNVSTVTCESADYCMFIKPCWICLEELQNPECRPMKIILMFSNLLSIFYIIGHKLFKLWRRYKLRRDPDYGFQLNLFKRKRSDESILVRFRKLSATVRESSYKTAIVISVVLMLFASIAAAEDDVVDSLSITAQKQQCTVNSNGWVNCKISEVTQFTTNSYQPSHLLINYNDRPIGSITVTPEVHFECTKLTKHFTRIGSVQTSSVKICGGRNLCSGYECAQSTTQMAVPALGRANELPGNTYCQETCGGWMCKCWTWGEACLYYRNYVSPSDPRIFEVFTCSSWRTKLILNTTVTTQHETTSRLLIMNEGHSIEFNTIKVSAMDLNPQSTPPTAEYSFISTGKSTALLFDAGVAAANIMQCPDKSSAEALNCSMHEECHCTPADGIASCSCLNNQVLLKQINQNALPVSAHDMFFEATPSGTVIARVDARPRLQLEMNNMHLFTSIDLNTCTAKVHSIEGCSSCNEGAVLQITCSTDFGTAAAHVTCPDMSFPISCSKDGHFQKITLFFNNANVDSECQLRCPSKVSTIQLKATLKKATLINSWSKVQADVHADTSLVVELLKAGKELIESNYHYLIIVLVITGVSALFLLYVFKKFI